MQQSFSRKEIGFFRGLTFTPPGVGCFLRIRRPPERDADMIHDDSHDGSRESRKEKKYPETEREIYSVIPRVLCMY